MPSPADLHLAANALARAEARCGVGAMFASIYPEAFDAQRLMVVPLPTAVPTAQLRNIIEEELFLGGGQTAQLPVTVRLPWELADSEDYTELNPVVTAFYLGSPIRDDARLLPWINATYTLVGSAYQAVRGTTLGQAAAATHQISGLFRTRAELEGVRGGRRPGSEVQISEFASKQLHLIVHRLATHRLIQQLETGQLDPFGIEDRALRAIRAVPLQRRHLSREWVDQIALARSLMERVDLEVDREVSDSREHSRQLVLAQRSARHRNSMFLGSISAEGHARLALEVSRWSAEPGPTIGQSPELRDPEFFQTSFLTAAGAAKLPPAYDFEDLLRSVRGEGQQPDLTEPPPEDGFYL